MMTDTDYDALHLAGTRVADASAQINKAANISYAAAAAQWEALIDILAALHSEQQLLRSTAVEPVAALTNTMQMLLLKHQRETRERLQATYTLCDNILAELKSLQDRWLALEERIPIAIPPPE
jgi:hypothetical protein